MKRFKRYPTWAGFLLVLILLGGCSAEGGSTDPGVEPVAMTGITNSMGDVVTVAEGMDCQLDYILEPSDATNQTVIWSSGNTDIVTVNSTGLMTGVSAGTATITATTADGGFSTDYSISVTEYIPVTGITLSRTSITTTLSSYEVLTVTVTPENASDKSYAISSSDTGVVSIYSEHYDADTSILLTQGGGNAKITVSAGEGSVSAECSLTVVPVHVFTGGYLNFTVGTSQVVLPAVWHDKPLVSISPASGSYGGYINDLTVQNGVIYAAGSQYNSYQFDNPVYWTDGTATVLNSVTSGHWASGISVYDGTVYTAGSYKNKDSASPVDTACYWRGTVRTSLPGDGVHASRATGIMVVGGTVYTSGYYSDGTKNIACYWTGTTRTDLPGDGTHAALTSGIHVANGVVYTGGYWNNGTIDTACYWTGTTRTDLSGISGKNSMVSDITVSGGTVYTSGYYSNGICYRPCYWTGTTRSDLEGVATGNNGSASSIAVKNGTVFTCGTYNEGLPCYWIGTKQVQLQQLELNTGIHSVNNGGAYAIDVTD